MGSLRRGVSDSVIDSKRMSLSADVEIYQTEDLQLLSKNLQLERLNIYERISNCSVSEREKIYDMFEVAHSEKRKKQKVAEMICKYEIIHYPFYQ